MQHDVLDGTVFIIRKPYDVTLLENIADLEKGYFYNKKIF